MPEQKYVRYGGQTMELPAGMSLEEAKAQMARFFPELAEPHVETQKDGDKTTYVFSKQAGRKGATQSKSSMLERKTIIFSFRMDADTRRQLERIAASMERKPGDAVRVLIREEAKRISKIKSEA